MVFLELTSYESELTTFLAKDYAMDKWVSNKGVDIYLEGMFG